MQNEIRNKSRIRRKQKIAAAFLVSDMKIVETPETPERKTKFKSINNKRKLNFDLNVVNYD